MKKEKGITIVALVVTIAILLILAGVTVGALFGENGIVTKAQDAADQMNAAAAQEQQDMEDLLGYLDGTYVPGTDSGGNKVNLLEYATLDLTAYMGHIGLQKCNYLGMYIELSEVGNEESESIKFNIGTDWNENIEKKDSNNLFLLEPTTEMKLLKNMNRDGKYRNDNTEMSKDMLNAFTDVKLKCRVKKGTSYIVRVKEKHSKVINFSTREIGCDEITVYEQNLDNVNDNREVTLESLNYVAFNKIFDANGDGHFDTRDCEVVTSVSNGVYAVSESITKIYSENSTFQNGLVLIDENGNIKNEECAKNIGFDYNRDGVINSDDRNLTLDYANSCGTWLWI